MTASLTHLAMHVRDLEACVAFYRRFCGLRTVHERPADKESAHGPGNRVVWLAEPGREKDFILVLIPGGPGRDQAARDFSHLGFAMESKAAVDGIADAARADGCLVWEPREEPYPVGYYCGLKDPDGNFVEFSYGQPLGPGAAEGPDAAPSWKSAPGA
jgi:catechol 2,3-dioxygenase-like lactoylglutathione lyase family enzyme